MSGAAEDRERDFWDHHVPTLDECVAEYERGPDVYSRAMIEALRPGPGTKILDFACGAGVTSAWLAAHGGEVVGVDLSPTSIRRAEELRSALGLSYETRVVGPTPGDVDVGVRFDGVAGRFALHHLDLSAFGPALAAVLRPGGTAAFVETMATNPLLRLSRKALVGRFGIARFGTTDEHPLTRRDLEGLRANFGSLEVRTPGMVFFHLIDRQVLRGRRPALGRYLTAADRALARSKRLGSLSYHQVIVLRKEPARVPTTG